MKIAKCSAAPRVAGLGHVDLDPKPRFPGRDQRWPLPRPVKLCSVGHAEGAKGVTNVEPASQAETAGSILVARTN